MGILDKAKSNLGKKLNGNQELNKEVLRWKKSLLEANRLLEGKKEAEKKEGKSTKIPKEHY